MIVIRNNKWLSTKRQLKMRARYLGSEKASTEIQVSVVKGDRKCDSVVQKFTEIYVDQKLSKV